MIHCPVLRKGFQLRTGTPVTDRTAVNSNGPIIQGMGVCKYSQHNAAPHAPSKVNKTCLTGTRASGNFMALKSLKSSQS
jgi:hypothetical protein